MHRTFPYGWRLCCSTWGKERCSPYGESRWYCGPSGVGGKQRETRVKVQSVGPDIPLHNMHGALQTEDDENRDEGKTDDSPSQPQHPQSSYSLHRRGVTQSSCQEIRWRSFWRG